jgi:hypothetical protein
MRGPLIINYFLYLYSLSGRNRYFAVLNRTVDLIILQIDFIAYTGK